MVLYLKNIVPCIKTVLNLIVKYEAKYEKSTKCWYLMGFGSNVLF